MSNRPETIQALHPDPAKQGPRVNGRTYRAYRDALLAVIPDTPEGIPFGDLAGAVAGRVPDDVRGRTSPGWWATTVKLDLEARGLIERIEGRGKQRVRRTGRRED